MKNNIKRILIAFFIFSMFSVGALEFFVFLGVHNAKQAFCRESKYEVSASPRDVVSSFLGYIGENELRKCHIENPTPTLENAIAFLEKEELVEDVIKHNMDEGGIMKAVFWRYVSIRQ